MSYKFISTCLKFSHTVLFLLLLQTSNAQQTFTDVEDVITQKQKILGQDIVVMVANKDTVVYQKTQKIFNPRTQAPIGQTSQWLTAALILQLADEGKLSLDDKVSQYIPAFEKYGKNYITIRHCLTHFTGIQSEAAVKALKMFEKKKFQNLEEEVNSIASKEIKTNPGTEFSYSNFGPAIAARVAEIVTKKKFDALIQQKLFRPMGMRQTTFSTIDGSSIDAAAGARSTANDMIRFLEVLLNNGSLKGVTILSEAAVKELRTIQASGILKNAPETAKGFEYTLGAWSTEPAINKEAIVLTAPGFNGTLPIVDFCRGYAFLLIVKQDIDDAKANLYPAIKNALDQHFPNKCK